jgi:hypothetical protein
LRRSTASDQISAHRPLKDLGFARIMMTHMTRTCHPNIGLRHTQIGHVVPRIRHRGGKGGMYVRLMKQPSHLLRLSSKWLPTTVFLPQIQSKLWMRSEIPARTFHGRKIERSIEKRKLDGLKALLSRRKSLNLQRTRFRGLDLVIAVSMLRGNKRQGKRRTAGYCTAGYSTVGYCS